MYCYGSTNTIPQYNSKPVAPKNKNLFSAMKANNIARDVGSNCGKILGEKIKSKGKDPVEFAMTNEFPKIMGEEIGYYIQDEMRIGHEQENKSMFSAMKASNIAHDVGSDCVKILGEKIKSTEKDPVEFVLTNEFQKIIGEEFGDYIKDEIKNGNGLLGLIL